MCSDDAFEALIHFLMPAGSRSPNVLSVYNQIMYMYDIKLDDEREVAKAMVEFFTEELDPDLPLQDALTLRNKEPDQSDEEDGADDDGEDDDSEGATPLSSDHSKHGCVIFVFNRDSILERNEADIEFLESVKNSSFLNGFF